MAKKLMTTKEAAEYAGVSTGTFQKRARGAGIQAEETSKSGGRGRPAFLWTIEQVKAIIAPKK